MNTKETRDKMQFRTTKESREIRKLTFLICADCKKTVEKLLEANIRFVCAKYRLKELALLEKIERAEEFKQK